MFKDSVTSIEQAAVEQTKIERKRTGSYGRRYP